MSAVLQDQPLPARLLAWPAAQATPLARCLFLALLLHLWAVLMLGTAPGGTALPGQGVFGAINVTLRGPVSDNARDESPAATPVPGMAPDSSSPRWGGRVRQTELPPDSLPGAERLGVPAPQAPQALPAAAPQALPVTTPEAPPALLSREAPETPVEPPQVAPVPSPEPTPAPAPAERKLSTPLLPPVRSGTPALAREPAAVVGAELPTLPTPGASPAALRQLQQAVPAAVPRMPQAELPRTLPADTVSLPSVPAPPAPGTLVQTPGLAGPDAGSRVGHDVATPAAAAASQPPRLNLELARPRGGELSRFATSGALPVLPRPPEVDDKLARDIEKAGKADCRKAYAGAGVLAVVPLVADAVKGSGCKW
jgi:hypothetical protein